MKTKKQKLLASSLLIAICSLLIVFALTGCPEPEQPKNQTATIDGLFDNNATATVKGNLTDTEWNGVPEKIKTALTARFEDIAVDAIKTVFMNTYTLKDVVIIIEKNPSYANYSTTRDGDTAYINFGILNNTDALKLALYNVTVIMAGTQTIPEQS